MANETAPPEVIEAELVEASNPAALVAATQAEVDTQVTTARRYPRNITEFDRKAQTLIRFNKDTAKAMWYTLPPRKDENGKEKIITGPGVRLAEVVASCWGNISVAVRTTVEEDFVVAQGVGIDWESNARYVVETRRSIKGRKGRFSNDMIRVTSNAAASIAFREAVFRAVPRVYVQALWKVAQQVAIGGEKLTMPEMRKAAIAEYKKEIPSSTPEQLLAILKRKGWDDVDLEDLVTLRGYLTAMDEGNLSWATLIEHAGLVKPADAAPGGGAQTWAPRPAAGQATPTPAPATPKAAKGKREAPAPAAPATVSAPEPVAEQPQSAAPVGEETTPPALPEEGNAEPGGVSEDEEDDLPEPPAQAEPPAVGGPRVYADMNTKERIAIWTTRIAAADDKKALKAIADELLLLEPGTSDVYRAASPLWSARQRELRR